MDWSGFLRGQVRERAQAWAANHGYPHYSSLGNPATVMFEPTEDRSRHGNFHDASWQAICGSSTWAARLSKAHQRAKRLPSDKTTTARELDSSNSSDALLMNCFCFPGAAPLLLKGLDLPPQSGDLEFGFKAQLPLVDGSRDTTEVDLRFGGLLFEAKLTEQNFTTCSKAHLFRYMRLSELFDADLLPATDGEFVGYQLVRNVLAAAEHQATLVVLIDGRRPDLLREWWAVHAAVRDGDLRTRCGVRTWQEVAAASPPALKAFLEEKYGL